MKAREITDRVDWMGAVDWDRRLFDALIPLPDGTSYNAYLVRGSDKTALIDSADPDKLDILMSQLDAVDKLDYVVCQHVEQDHSGSIPQVLARYPGARVFTTPKGKDMAVDHLKLSPEGIEAVQDGQTLSLGDRTLEFMYTPWVHWPETMSTYLAEEELLFSCDFFGSHLASSELFVTDEGLVYEAAKRYFAEIMMPFRKIVQSNLKTVRTKEIRYIAPSHGQVYDRPDFILDAYDDWTSEAPKNVAVIPYVSMHGSTAAMVEYLINELGARGVKVYPFNLPETDLGKLAIALVDAATLVIGTPTVHVGPHPAVFYATHLANCLRPKVRYASVVGSYGWNSKAIERIEGLLPNLKIEMLDPVLCRGMARDEDFQALDRLAETIAAKHAGL